MVKWILATSIVANCLNAFGAEKLPLVEVYARAERGEVVEIAVGIKPIGKQVSSDAPWTMKGGLQVEKPSGSYVVFKDEKGVVVVTTTATVAVAKVDHVSGDGLDEVNAKRAQRGLRPFIRDDSLTQGALACAAERARLRLFGHTSNDFRFLPSGTSAAAAGCAAYQSSYGWMSCCTYDNHTYGGAAWVMGSDGKRYMHLFVR